MADREILNDAIVLAAFLKGVVERKGAGSVALSASIIERIHDLGGSSQREVLDAAAALSLELAIQVGSVLFAAYGDANACEAAKLAIEKGYVIYILDDNRNIIWDIDKARLPEFGGEWILAIEYPAVLRIGVRNLVEECFRATGQSLAIMTAQDQVHFKALISRLLNDEPKAPTKVDVLSGLWEGGPATTSWCAASKLRADPGAIADVLGDTPKRFVIAAGHGRPYCALHGAVCGRSVYAAAGDSDCFDGFECAYPQFRRVPIGAYRWDSVLLASCGAFDTNFSGPGDAVGLPVGIRFLQTAKAIIAPINAMEPDELLLLMCANMAYEGNSIGDICRALNREYGLRTGLACTFAVCGDPNMRPYWAAEVERTVDRIGKGGVLCAEVPGPISFYQLTESEFGVAKDGVMITGQNGQEVNADALVLAPRGGEAGRLLVLDRDCGRFPLFVRLFKSAGVEPLFEELCSHLRYSCLHGRALGYAQSLFAKAEAEGSCSKYQELADVVSSLAQKLEKVRTRGVASFEPRVFREKAYRSMAEGSELLFKTFCRYVQSRSIRVNVLYQRANGYRWLDTRMKCGRCMSCAGETDAYDYAIGFGVQQERRWRLCERCGFLDDMENGSSGVMQIDCPEDARLGEKFNVRVHVGGITAITLVSVGLSLEGQKQDGMGVEIEPACRHLVCKDAVDSSFAVRVSTPSRRQVYYLLAMAMVRGSLLLSARPIKIL